MTPRAYSFSTAAQWQRCLASGFGIGGGIMRPIAKFGTRAHQMPGTARVSLVATDRLGELIWRQDTGSERRLFRRTETNGVSRPLTLDGALARSPRWILERHWLWAFDVERRSATRYDRDTFVPDLTVDLTEWESVEDIAGDGDDGLWILVGGADGAMTLLHLDCHARQKERVEVPSAVRRPAQLGMLRRGALLVLLGAGGLLTLIDTKTKDDIRSSSAWRSGPCWIVDRLATDGDGTIALLCHEKGFADRCTVFVLDAEGDALDRLPGAPGGACASDVAVGSVLWLAAADGLWSLDAGDASGARESESVLLTPALFSPEDGPSRGWLRAEIDTDLPPGAVLEVEAATTADDRIARQADELAGDLSRSAAERRRDIWNLFDHRGAKAFHFTGTAGQGQSVGMPLFDKPERWLWLQLRVVTPPGVTPPLIRALRVLYPDASLMQYVPAVFKGADNDPTGFFRSIVGVLETTTESIDARIRSIGDGIDPWTAPEPWLDAAARWLAMPWEDALPVPAKRALMENAGLLLQERGTRRGVERLLRALAGPQAHVRVSDLTVDYGPGRLGGGTCTAGARLPMLLAGPPAAAPILNSRAVLGRACLGISCDPLRPLAPTLAIEIAAPRFVQRERDVLVRRIVAQYVPADIAVIVRWRSIATSLAALGGGDGDVLDAAGQGRLNDDSELGRVVLGGRAGTLDGAGLDVGFPLT